MPELWHRLFPDIKCSFLSKYLFTSNYQRCLEVDYQHNKNLEMQKVGERKEILFVL